MQNPPNDSTELAAEHLLQHVAWLRALAGQLVADADLADDLTQDAMVVALERPPRELERLRAWLARVLRNLVRDRVRSGANERARERSRARTDALPATDELVERIHVQRQLAELVVELGEPYRTVVLLRFFEDRPPREIAQQSGLPLGTVKSQLARGLTKLRERLDTAYDQDRSAWLAALLPLASPSLATPVTALRPETSAPTAQASSLPPATAATFGGLALNTKSLAALALAATGAWWVLRDSAPLNAPSTPETDIARAEATPAKSSASPQPAKALPPDGSRSALTEIAGAEPASAPKPDPIAPFRVVGRVLDSEGLPASGLQVCDKESGEPLAVSGDGGRFAFETVQARGFLVVPGESWVTIREGAWQQAGRLAPVLVVAPAINLRGEVVNEIGAGVMGARVSLLLPEDFRTRFEEPLDASTETKWTVASAVDGSFELERVPAISGARLLATQVGYAAARGEAPRFSMDGLRLTLIAPSPTSAVPIATLDGRVLRADGRPAVDAHVALGFAIARPNEQGFFSLRLDRAGSTELLLAAEEGQRPARMQRPGLPSEDSSGWPEFVELRLGDPALAIRGRVVDERGAPVVGARVWLDDPTSFGNVGTFPMRLENLMAGASIPERAIDSIGELPKTAGEEEFGHAGPLEAPDGFFFWVVSDGQGRFEFPGLDERSYTLRVADELRRTMLSDPIRPGGNEVELVLPDAEVYPVLRGRVVTRHGDGVPGVGVQQFAVLQEAQVPVFGGSSSITYFLTGASARTDDGGRFEFRDIPRRYLGFYLISDEIVPSYGSVDDVTDPEKYEIVVEARVHFQVEVDPSEADSIRVRDGAGAPIDILVLRADGYSNHDAFALVNGSSGIVTTTSNAATVELLRAGEVVDALSVTLRPGEVTYLSP